MMFAFSFVSDDEWGDDEDVDVVEEDGDEDEKDGADDMDLGDEDEDDA